MRVEGQEPTRAYRAVVDAVGKLSVVHERWKVAGWKVEDWSEASRTWRAG
jgi:hypothetical protein